jgi:hypothetical protein
MTSIVNTNRWRRRSLHPAGTRHDDAPPAERTQTASRKGFVAVMLKTIRLTWALAVISPSRSAISCLQRSDASVEHRPISRNATTVASVCLETDLPRIKPPAMIARTALCVGRVVKFVIARSESDEAIQSLPQASGLLRFARNDY